jgi:molybdopterin molybdotransferase
MIEVDEARNYILKHVDPLPAEEVFLLKTLDRVLAEDVVAGANVPPFDNSAMDGYAVRAADTTGASPAAPVTLRLVGTVAAGSVPDRPLSPGRAIRIMTGAPIPPGADAVVRFEDTDEAQEETSEEEIRIFRAASVGENVRLAGEDIRRGRTVIRTGTVIRPQEIGVLASLGRSHVRVHRRPRVAVLATGDELVALDEPIGPGQIRNSNEYSNAALVMRYGGIPICLGIAQDDVEHLTAKIREALEQNVDLFLTSAGVSVGDYDVVKDVLASEGEMHFWQVRIKPGKPLAFGRIGGVPIIGLPGNPVSSIVAFEVFARPALLKMAGHTRLEKPRLRAILKEDVHNSGRRHYMRALVTRQDDKYYVTTRGSGVAVQGSGILTSLLWANALVVIPEDTTYVPAGTTVDTLMLGPMADA